MRHHLFDTKLGRLGVAWTDEGLARVSLPDENDEALKARLSGTPGRPPPAVRATVAKIRAHLEGDLQDFSEADGVPQAGDFDRRVYAFTRQIPAGHIRRYGDVAEALGSKGLSRAVGQALGRNPMPIVVPCHRVLAAQGAMGGFSARGGVDLKRELLSLEGALPLPGLFAADGSLAIDERAVRLTLTQADPQLGELLAKVGPLRLTPRSHFDSYESLAHAIVGQQITTLAAKAIFARFEQAFGGALPRPEELLRASDEALRAVGLSRPKMLALRDLAAKVIDGTVLPLRALEQMGDRAIIERLSQVRGIGQWTVEMLLIFRLGRPDVLPVDDYGIRKGFGRVFLKGRHAKPAEMLRRAERWRPYRSVASWYLWRALELP